MLIQKLLVLALHELQISELTVKRVNFSTFQQDLVFECLVILNHFINLVYLLFYTLTVLTDLLIGLEDAEIDCLLLACEFVYLLIQVKVFAFLSLEVRYNVRKCVGVLC